MVLAAALVAVQLRLEALQRGERVTAQVGNLQAVFHAEGGLHLLDEADDAAVIVAEVLVDARIGFGEELLQPLGPPPAGAAEGVDGLFDAVKGDSSETTDLLGVAPADEGLQLGGQLLSLRAEGLQLFKVLRHRAAIRSGGEEAGGGGVHAIQLRHRTAWLLQQIRSSTGMLLLLFAFRRADEKRNHQQKEEKVMRRR